MADENRRRQYGQFWARLGKPVPIPLEELKKTVDRILGIRGAQWVERKTDYLISCGSEGGLKALMAMSNWEVRGTRMNVTQVERQMTGPEIFRFVADRLQAKERAEGYDNPTHHQEGG